jgi:hypothetical protein
MGRTRKPCPGCGKANGLWREAGTVCNECRRILSAYRLRLKAAQAPKKSGEVRLAVPTAAHWLPYLMHGGEPFGRDARAQFQKAFLDLTTAISTTPIMDRYKVGMGWDAEELIEPKRSDAGIGTFPVGVVDPLRRLYAAANLLAQIAYRQGHEEGTNLLAQLASGERTVADFNETKARCETMEDD